MIETLISFAIGLVVILIFEYIGDFLLQSREMALKKSSEGSFLREHLVRIGLLLASGAILLQIFGLVIPSQALAMLIIPYCLIHGIQDWYIWRGYKVLIYKRIKKHVDKIEGNTEEAKIYILKNKLELFKSNKDYAEDKMFYDFIGLDRVFHVISIVVLYTSFFILML